MKKVKSVFGFMEKHRFEQVTFFQNKVVDLRGIICIHNTSIGPACGSTRMYPYFSESEALYDGLRLAEMMTYKNSGAGINFGGGSAVLMGDPEQLKNENYLRAFGRQVESFSGRFIAGEGVNVTPKDMHLISLETDHVSFLVQEENQVAKATVEGVFQAIKACAKYKYGSEDLRGLICAVHGVGRSGRLLLDKLYKDEAEIIFTDIDPEKIEYVKAHYPEATFIESERFFDEFAHILCPCSIDIFVTEENINDLNTDIVCGTINNALEYTKLADELFDKNIIYAPDFIVNAGGVIYVSQKMNGFRQDRYEKEIGRISERVTRILEISEQRKIAPVRCARILADERIQMMQNVRRNYI